MLDTTENRVVKTTVTNGTNFHALPPFDRLIYRPGAKLAVWSKNYKIHAVGIG